MLKSSSQNHNNRAIVLWLFGVAALIFLMVMVGGATRLTGSGLSMTDWRPITGVVPPLDLQAWQAEFARYQESPEYRLVNAGMTLAEFKTIFYWEWGHRLLGRLIGLAYALPLFIFWVLGKVPAGFRPRLLMLLLLGGAQGLLGWYMVKSGLVDVPEVSHYRLVAHLSLALFLFAAILWTALTIHRGQAPISAESPHSGLIISAGIVLTLQIVMGGLVAGLDAGHVADDWPLMMGQVIPDGVFELSPLWSNFVDNQITVHFDHRIGAYLFFALALSIWLKTRSGPANLHIAAKLLLGATILQVILGVVTILTHVPVHWGTLHQGGGVVVLAAYVNLVHISRFGYL